MSYIQAEGRFSDLAGSLHALAVTKLQINLGRVCNQACAHCHLEASPDRADRMERSVMHAIVRAVAGNGIRDVDITGGAPELNQHLRWLITQLRCHQPRINLRTNLTALLEPDLKGLAAFLHANEVNLSASLPCYAEDNVEAQRGQGVFAKSIAALLMLNDLGYGTPDGPDLELVHNPVGPHLPASQRDLAEAYRGQLAAKYGITFTRLIAITNMPIGGFRTHLLQQGRLDDYYQLLERSYNRRVLNELMCRRSVTVRWDGTLYDCDFNLALDLPVAGAPSSIGEFSAQALEGRPIVTGDHCLACTAGAGSSCGGALEAVPE